MHALYPWCVSVSHFIRGTAVIWNVQNVVICYAAESGSWKWAPNPWMVLGLRSRQHCNSFNGYSPAVSTFLFFSSLALSSLALSRRRRSLFIARSPFLFTVTVKTQSYQFRSTFYTQTDAPATPIFMVNYIKVSVSPYCVLETMCVCVCAHSRRCRRSWCRRHRRRCRRRRQNCENGSTLFTHFISHKYSRPSDSYLISSAHTHTNYGIPLNRPLFPANNTSMALLSCKLVFLYLSLRETDILVPLDRLIISLKQGTETRAEEKR